MKHSAIMPSLDNEEAFRRALRRSYPQLAQPNPDLLPECAPVPPLRLRANWHRRMAMACLRANSSHSVRLRKYRAHVNKARALEAQAAQEVAK